MENWLNYSSMDKSTFSLQLSGLSILNGLISHPFTVLSVRQQAGPAITGDTLKPGSVFNQLRQTYQKIGFKGLYRGFVAKNALGVPSDVMYFAMMESSREYFQREYRILFPNTSRVAIDWMQAASTAVLSICVSNLPFVPAEVLMSRLIVSRTNESNIDMTKNIYKESGIKGFYKGFTPACMVGTIISSQWWWTYSVCKRYTPRLPFYKEHQLLVDGASGLVAGLSAAAVVHPIDTIKTIIMASHSDNGKSAGFLRTLVRTVKQEGVLRLYRGLPAVLYLTALGSSVFAFSYELIKSQSKAE